MKRFLVCAALFLCLGLSARAQVFILNDDLFQGRMSEVRTTVVDSLTNEALGFASVYVVPSKDTTITNFTLTDVNGVAKLEEVPYGSYVLHVEMMGYRPFLKEQYFREMEVDMGTIRLQQDEQFLQAAVVSDVGNPIVIKKDTVEFNASSFRVGANAMLKDLIKRMPGMEITDDGKVKFNGEEIDKLTVGGRTFFFGDQSTALNNLPASVVDKVRVIDRESEETRASGIQDGSREKVLDVGLKKEYEKGWFGNAGVKGGTTAGEKEGADMLRDDRGFLWSGNALASSYTDKDQITVIGNAQNINDSNGVVVIISEDGETSSLDQGLSTAAQLGLNANTSRIKDVETTVSVNYKYTDTDSGNKAERTTYQEDGNLSSTSENSGKSYANSLNANLEFQKEKGKVWFHVRPGLHYTTSDTRSNVGTETFRGDSFVNRSGNMTQNLSTTRYALIDSDVTFRDLGGRKGRNIAVDLTSSYSLNGGESNESSSLTTAGKEESRTMKYLSDGSGLGFDGSVRYTEPFGEKWTLSAVAGFEWSKRDNKRDAFDAAGRNDYYSSVSNSRYMEQQYDLTAQYKFGEGRWITLGGRMIGSLNETYSKSYGIEDVTGKDEWNWFFTPTLRFEYSKGNDRVDASASGYSSRPSSSRMLPVLNIGNPSRLSLGNVYLKPSSQTSFSTYWMRNNVQRFSNMMIFLYGSFNVKPVVSALWYDTEGILYSIPVNATRPSVSASLNANYTTPLDGKKAWSLTLQGNVGYVSSVSYQASGSLAGLDRDGFDYSAFMKDFWGNASGDRFYGGESGFARSSTRSFAPGGGLSVKYNHDRYSLSAGASTQGRISRYSLDPRADMNTLDSRLWARASYSTRHEFDLETDLGYSFYNGYARGYGRPEWRWNAEISKNIGAFNLSVKVHDILNQTRSLTHTVTANYEEDSYRLVMGRYVLFGVKWNFGKMNAVHSRRAQQAAFNMVF